MKPYITTMFSDDTSLEFIGLIDPQDNAVVWQVPFASANLSAPVYDVIPLLSAIYGGDMQLRGLLEGVAGVSPDRKLISLSGLLATDSTEATYTLVVQLALIDADGFTIAARLQETVDTPGMGVPDLVLLGCNDGKAWVGCFNKVYELSAFGTSQISGWNNETTEPIVAGGLLVDVNGVEYLVFGATSAGGGA